MKEASAMASISKAGPATTLGEFLARRDIDGKPYLEFIDGRVEAKMSPRSRHVRIQKLLVARLDAFALGRGGLGEAFPELRCTFGGRSILPDVAFFRRDRITYAADGRITDEMFAAPDLHIEVLSPDQQRREVRERLVHSAAHGARLGWLIDPYTDAAEVHRPGAPMLVVAGDGVLTGEPVLPGFALPVADLWACLGPPR
jgi:Uma2 family endonuclease